jgi:hypothetical protein
VLVYGYVERQGDRHGWAQRPSEKNALDRALLRARATLGDDVVERLRKQGCSLADDAASDIALALVDGAGA